jgi:RNA polymerase sigma-70 factor (ECF subfamily)
MIVRKCFLERGLESAVNDLVERAVRGEEDALVALLEEVGMILHTELESGIGGRYQGMVSADDVLQVTYLEAFLRIRSFIPLGPQSFLAWLRRISQNNLRDAIRELEREKRPSPARRITAPPGDDSYVSLLDQYAGKATTVPRAAARSEIRQVVDDALKRLPHDYETVLRLYELEGLSAPETAERMNRSHGAVRMLLSRARECLGEILGSESKYF